MKTVIHCLFLCSALLLLAGCETAEQRQATLLHNQMNASILAEKPGDYFIGRRYYKKDYKFWGYIRRPGQLWSTSQLVMMNEQKKLAPDREINQLGSDNCYEYKLYGYFSGDTVYEPASNGFYPEFVLTGYELISAAPPPIFHDPAITDPSMRIIGVPY